MKNYCFKATPKNVVFALLCTNNKRFLLIYAIIFTCAKFLLQSKLENTFFTLSLSFALTLKGFFLSVKPPSLMKNSYFKQTLKICTLRFILLSL